MSNGAPRQQIGAAHGCAASLWVAARDRPWVIAHRGDSFHAPENTLEAARQGFAAGADAWELDVRLTRDGVPVVIHDASLCRTTNVTERFADDPRGPHFRVADFDCDEIRTLDAGSWFLARPNGLRTAAAFGTLSDLSADDRARFTSGEVRVPTLAEAIALVIELDWCVNIELKTSAAERPAVIDAVLALVRDPAIARRAAISSFDHADMASVAQRRPDIATGVLTVNPLYRPAHYVREVVGAAAYHPSVAALCAGDGQDLRQADLASLQAAGVRLYVFTVNDARSGGLADQLAEAGVAGLFTDDPRSLAEHWNNHPSVCPQRPRTRAQ